MKKIVIITFACLLLVVFFAACKGKVKQAPTPKPQEEQPKVEKVEQPPAIQEPQLTEEEIFMRKTLEELNAEMPLEMIHFDYDKYFIREDAKPALEMNAAWMKKFRSAQILIEGHCDERGTEQYNLALGEKRAKSTQDYLLSLGISPDRIKIVSYGKSQPFDLGHNEMSWAKNRRAQFVIIGK